MDWKNLILGAAGVGLAPFTGGASLALTGAAIAAHGAKSSADTLAKGADQAVAVQSQQKQAAQQKLDTTQAQQAQLYAPYTALGSGAASSLGARMGLPAVPTSGNLPVAAPVSAPGAGLQPGTLGATSSVPTGPPAEGALLSSDARSRGTLASIGSAVQRQAAQQQTQSGYVTMRDPTTGETGRVPVHQIQFYQAKGGQVVA